METAFGSDFGAVRIHDDPASHQAAAGLNAKAFTTGSDIYFAKDGYDPASAKGQELLAHELTHVTQQRPGPSKKSLSVSDPNDPAERETDQVARSVASDRMPVTSPAADRRSAEPGLPARKPTGPDLYRTVPDDTDLGPSIDEHRAPILNLHYWQRYGFDAIKPMRELNPTDHPKAFANRTLESQRLLRDAGAGRAALGKPLARDGIFGPRTLFVLRVVASDPSLAEVRFDLAGVGVDLTSIASDEAVGGARDALIDIREPSYISEWATAASAEVVIEHIRTSDEAKSASWYDQVLFGGPPPENLRDDLSLGDRHAILARAYESREFRGRIGLVQVQRRFLDNIRDVHHLASRDDERGGSVHWVGFVADGPASLAKWEALFEIGFPGGRRVAKARQEIVDGIGDEERLVGLLLAFYLPEPTELERARLRLVADEYMEEKRLNVDLFIEPQGDRIVATLNDDELAWYIFASRLADLLRPFQGRPELFEKLLDYLRTHERGDQLSVFLDRAADLRVVPTLRTVVQLLRSSSLADDNATANLTERLAELQAKYQKHEYVTGPLEGVRLNKDKDRFLPVGGIAGLRSSAYMKTEDRKMLKEAPRKRLEEELEKETKARLQEILAAEGNANPYAGMSTEDFSGAILEVAAGECALTEDDFKEVGYEESLRLLGVKSELVDGVEEFYVDFEVVSRIAGGKWTVTEASEGFQSEDVFAERLFWYYYANVSDLLETIVLAEMIVIGGFVAWSSGAAAYLVALAGGKAVVGISIAASVFFWAVTAERLSWEGFFKAVIEGYLGALGLKFFGGYGLKAAGMVGTATFKQKLIGLVLSTWITGAGTGAVVGPAMVLVDDIIQGRLSSPSRYLTSLAVGMAIGIVAEFIGTGVIAPMFRTAGRNVLEKIASIEGLKDFVARSAKAIAPSVWLADMTSGLSRLRIWLDENVKEATAKAIFANAKERVERFLQSYLTGLELSVQRQALALAEIDLTREAVEGLERLIRVTTRTADDDVVSDLLNVLAKKPDHAVPYLKILDKLDDRVLKDLASGDGLRALTGAESGLRLSQRRSGQEMADLLALRFDGDVAAFDGFAARLLDLSDAVVGDVIDVLGQRGSAVTTGSVLRIAEAGVGLTDDVVGGLARLVKAVPDHEGIDVLLAKVPDDQVEGFLTFVRDAPNPDFDRVIDLVKNGDVDRKLFGLVDEAVGIDALELARELAASKALAAPEVARALKAMLGQGVDADKLRTIFRNVEGRVAPSPEANKLLNIQNFSKGMVEATSVPEFGEVVAKLTAGGDIDGVIDAVCYATYKNRWEHFGAIFKAKVHGKVLPIPRGFPDAKDFVDFSRQVRAIMGRFGDDIRVQGSSIMDFPEKVVADIDAGVYLPEVDYQEAMKNIFFKGYVAYVKQRNASGVTSALPEPSIAADIATGDYATFVADVRGRAAGSVNADVGVTVSNRMTSAAIAWDQGKVPVDKIFTKGERRKVRAIESFLRGLEEGGERTITGDKLGSPLDLGIVREGSWFDRPPFLQLER